MDSWTIFWVALVANLVAWPINVALRHLLKKWDEQRGSKV